MVDLPTLVYPTNATRIRRPRFLRWVAFCLSISAKRSFSNDIRFRMIRRSISNCVSPGPRRPTEPLPPPAPGTTSLTFKVSPQSVADGATCICTAPIQPEFSHWQSVHAWQRCRGCSEVRSSIFIFSSASILRICFAESSSSKMTIPISRSASSSLRIYSFISSSLPLPTYVTELAVVNF